KLQLASLQMPRSIQNDPCVRGKDTVRTNIALPLQTALCKILIVELDGVLVLKRSTGNLAENPVIAFQLGENKRRAPFSLG
ncbi:hypothetical protein KAU37_02315, partial [Candidatus Bipolaricaulota bacterium]|nr:hypothetical protein [Candidatus Bipolaricaulota bacterium]